MLFTRMLSGAAGWLCAAEGTEESVSTTIDYAGNADAAWRALVTYEEVTHRPPWLLRVLLPQPVGTKGDKTQVGAMIACRYREGSLFKRIEIADAPEYLQFEVLEQRLGIERWIVARGGSYEIRPSRSGLSCRITLVTDYCGRLRPRWLWRRMEEYVAHRFHRHVLAGMKNARSEEMECSTTSVSLSRRS